MTIKASLLHKDELVTWTVSCTSSRSFFTKCFNERVALIKHYEFFDEYACIILSMFISLWTYNYFFYDITVYIFFWILILIDVLFVCFDEFVSTEVTTGSLFRYLKYTYFFFSFFFKWIFCLSFCFSSMFWKFVKWNVSFVYIQLFVVQHVVKCHELMHLLGFHVD